MSKVYEGSFYEMYLHGGEEQDVSSINPIVNIHYDITDFFINEDGDDKLPEVRKLKDDHTAIITYSNGDIIHKKRSELNEEEKEFLANNSIKTSREIDVDSDIYHYLNKKKINIEGITDKIKDIVSSKIQEDYLEDPKEFYWLEYYNNLYNTKQHNFNAYKRLLIKYGSPYLPNPYIRVEQKFFNYHPDILIGIDIEKYFIYYLEERKNINRICSLLKITNEFELEKDNIRDLITIRFNQILSNKNNKVIEFIELESNEIGEKNKVWEKLESDMTEKDIVTINKEVADFSDIQNMISSFINKRNDYLSAKKALFLNLIFGDGITIETLDRINVENILMLYAVLMSDISNSELKEIYETEDYFERFRLDMGRQLDKLNFVLMERGLPIFDMEVFNKIISSKISYSNELYDGRLPFFLVEYIILDVTVDI